MINEKDLHEAPAHLSNEEAHAWVSGWNAARAAMIAERKSGKIVITEPREVELLLNLRASLAEGEAR